VLPNDDKQNDIPPLPTSPHAQPSLSPGPAMPPRSAVPPAVPPREVGGREGPEPTRFGDWERKGIAVDF